MINNVGLSNQQSLVRFHIRPRLSHPLLAHLGVEFIAQDSTGENLQALLVLVLSEFGGGGTEDRGAVHDDGEEGPGVGPEEFEDIQETWWGGGKKER